MAFSAAEALQRLEAASRHNRLAHSLLITGAGTKEAGSFALELGGLILGVSASEATDHPDFHSIRPESKSRRILIEQIRGLEEHIHKKALLGSTKVAVLHDADRLQEAAANAFLKTLEEPPAGTHILLLSAVPEAMLPTILSRCVRVPLRKSSPDVWSEREERARHLALELLGLQPGPELPEIFRAVRKFQAILAEVRSEAGNSAKSLLDAEKTKLKDRTEASSSYLEDLEARFAASAESSVVRERSRLIDAIGSVFAERLLADLVPNDPRIARTDAVHLLRKMDALADLRSDLDRSMNEALALEAGFLEIFDQRE